MGNTETKINGHDAIDNPYEVKNVKTFTGMEGQGFNATLYRDGKRVALLIDDATGGELQIDWADYQHDRVNCTIQRQTYDGKPRTFKATPEEKLLYDFVEALPEFTPDWHDKPMNMTVDIFASDLVEDVLLARDLKSRFRNSLVYLNDRGEIMLLQNKRGRKTVPVDFEQQAAAIDAARKKYGVDTFLNEMPIAEAVAIYKAHG